MTNPGREVLPASLGAHPGFVWPLADGLDKAAHVLEFGEPEPAPVRRLIDGLLRDARSRRRSSDRRLRLIPRCSPPMP